MCGELATDFVNCGGTLSGSDNLDEVLGEYCEIRIGFFETLGELVTVLNLFGDFGDLLLEYGIITSLRSEIEGFDDRDTSLEEE